MSLHAASPADPVLEAEFPASGDDVEAVVEGVVEGVVEAVAPQGEGRPLGTDWTLFGAVVALGTLGVVMAFSASYYLAVHRMGDEFYFLHRHLRYAAIAMVALLGFSRLPYQALRTLAPVGLWASLGMLVLVLLIGETRNYATRWLFGFQPAELAKLGFIVFIAHALVRRVEKGTLRNFWRGMAPLLLIYGLFVGLLMKQPDMGTALVLGVLVFGMAFIAGARVAPLFWLGSVLIAAAGAFIAQNPMRLGRIMAWLDPFGDFHGKGYQLANSILAVALGGPFGRGLGASQQKLGFLPEAHTDFVLAILAEELGVVGVSLVAVLMLVVVWRGLAIAASARCEFGRLVAFGVTLLVGTQAAVNFGVVLGILPTKGLTLPFVSYGGTSLIVMAAAVGILLSIGRGGDPEWREHLPDLPDWRRDGRPRNRRSRRKGAAA
ncbi:MAG: putative lipid II flippase FtsW [Deltaproteobacteria bacterium]|nr:putative lipid II flippase FtsW [Deltaproteobacteria bacterium]